MDAFREPSAQPLTAGDLASMPDFPLGQARISPSRRTVSWPGGSTDLQPQVLLVLVLLAQNSGKVVSRETLFERCWGGIYVGDDSLNRTIAAIRKLAADVGDASFEVETIPRVGYRLLQSASGSHQATSGELSRKFSRRELASGAAALVALSSIGVWSALRSREARRFEALISEGKSALYSDNQFDPVKALNAFDAASRMRPNSATALGLLAVMRSYFAQGSSSEDSIAKVDLAAKTAQDALAIDPNEPNALLAMFELQWSTLDWIAREQRLRQIIRIDPANQPAISELTSLLESAGLWRESWTWNERGIALQPLSQYCLGRRALGLWAFGQLAESDKVIDQLRALFPTSRYTWSLRFRLYALTGRTAAAEEMLDADGKVLRNSPEALMWRACLGALADQSPSRSRKAREACLEAARASGEIAGQAVMALCAIGEVDAAFAVANGYLLSRGPVVLRGRPAYEPGHTDATLRVSTSWLFMPPCKAMRSDDRFRALCEGIGLADYWHRRSVQPDYIQTDR